MADFEVALSETRASVTPEMLEEYERIQETLKERRGQPDAAASGSCFWNAAPQGRAESPRRCELPAAGQKLLPARAARAAKAAKGSIVPPAVEADVPSAGAST